MENNFDELLRMEEENFNIPRRGKILKGKVIQVQNDGVVVNIGYKSDGIIPLNEFSNTDINPADVVKEGDEIEVFILKNDDGEGNVVLSKKRVDALKDWDVLIEKADANETVKIRTATPVKGGLVAYYKEVKGFIPASQVSLSYVDDLTKFAGQEFDAKVVEVDRSKNRVVFSRKSLLEVEQKAKKEAFWAKVEKDIIMEGEVKRISDFGAFVDLGGIDGLIHISEMSWGRIKHPSEVLKVGDIVKVYIKDFDKEKEKISLSLKQTIDNPWAVIDKNYQIGEVVAGKVTKLVDFGAFVELEPGLEGLVHISQIADKRIAKPSEVLSQDESVEVKILDINKDNKRLSLSIKEANVFEEAEEVEEVVEENEVALEGVDENVESTIGDVLKSKEDK